MRDPVPEYPVSADGDKRDYETVTATETWLKWPVPSSVSTCIEYYFRDQCKAILHHLAVSIFSAYSGHDFVFDDRRIAVNKTDLQEIRGIMIREQFVLSLGSEVIIE